MPGWLDELDLHPGVPEASMGTRSLPGDRWLSVDESWEGQRDEARRLLAERRLDVLASASDALTRDAAVEVGERIDGWLAAQRPDVADGAHRGEGDPVAAARVRVAEDVCLLTQCPSGWALAAGCVCFPSYWRLHDKVGRPLLDVHEPVPGYPGPLAGRVDAFLGRLHGGQGVWRRNWSIHDSGELFVPQHGTRAGVTPVEGRWLRSEYQTLLRLETAAAVVFTIRTQQVPVCGLAARPDVCAGLAAALRGWTAAQHAYKGGAVDGPLLDWLDAHAQS